MPAKSDPVAKSLPFVHIGEVLDQPLPALSEAITAFRNRGQRFVLPEANEIAREAPRLLSCIVESIPSGLAVGLMASGVALLLDGAAFSPQVAELMRTIARRESKAVVRSLVCLFDHAVEQRRLEVHARIDVVELVQLFAEGDVVLKDAIGAALMARILAALAGDPREHFALRRSLCSAIISLIHNSAANKLRPLSYTPIVQTLMSTTDFFLQLQCVELLYRVSRQHRGLLDAVAAELPPLLFRGIRALSNTDSLLSGMLAMLDEWHASRDEGMILRLTATQVFAHHTRLCAETTVYFSPQFLTVMLPSAKNLTIEYSTIASVRECRNALTFRLTAHPSSTDAEIDVATGRGKFVLNLPEEELQRYRRFGASRWVHAAKDSALAVNATPSPSPSPSPPATIEVHGRRSGCGQRVAGSPKRASEHDETSKSACGGVDNAPQPSPKRHMHEQRDGLCGSDTRQTANSMNTRNTEPGLSRERTGHAVEQLLPPQLKHAPPAGQYGRGAAAQVEPQVSTMRKPEFSIDPLVGETELTQAEEQRRVTDTVQQQADAVRGRAGRLYRDMAAETDDVLAGGRVTLRADRDAFVSHVNAQVDEFRKARAGIDTIMDGAFAQAQMALEPFREACRALTAAMEHIAETHRSVAPQLRGHEEEQLRQLTCDTESELQRIRAQVAERLSVDLDSQGADSSALDSLAP